MRGLLGLGASFLFIVACDRPPDLVVDLRTDYIAGVEFQSASVSVNGSPPVEVWLDADRDYLRGVRLIELAELGPGIHHVEVFLLRGPHIVAERSLLVDLVQTSAVTAVFTRDCRDVTCPGTVGDTARQTCLAGTCVGGECTPETPGTCSSQCASDSECSPSQPCSTATCQGGVCLESDSGSCGEGSFCHPDSGCRPSGSSSCPTYMQAVDGFCIDIFEQGSMTWTDASAYCTARGGDLCSESEWAAACTAPDSALIDATDDWEWTSDLTDGSGGKSGESSCDARSAHEILVDFYTARCCTSL